MIFYVVGKSADDLKNFFSVLPEEQRPKIVSDKENPAVWDHASDKPVVIATDEPRVDSEATEINIDDKQVDDVMSQIQPSDEIISDDAVTVPEETPEAPETVKGPLTYADRGFKVGRLV